MLVVFCAGGVALYTDDDLAAAVDRGIFSKQAVGDFRVYVDSMRENKSVDDEQFRLVSGFNDIFVIILSVVLLSSVMWLARTVFGSWGMLAYLATVWGLSEVYVRRRRMALPAVFLLLAFTLGVYHALIYIAYEMGIDGWTEFLWHTNPYVIYAAALASALATWGHWLRFKVPITVAAGVGMLVLVVVAFFHESDTSVRVSMFVSGIAVLALAMYWDMSDLKRVSRRSDIAFWLHLLAAPLLVHPVFTMFNVFADISVGGTIAVLALYVVLSVFSLLINRRSLMVSALFYVIYAVNNFMSISTSSDTVEHLAITGVLISLPLLVLSAKWHAARGMALACFPKVKQYLPAGGT